MNTGHCPVVPVTPDCSRSILFHLANTNQFLHPLPHGRLSSLPPSLWTLLPFPGFFFSCALYSSTCPLAPTPTPCTTAFFEATNGANSGNGFRVGVDPASHRNRTPEAAGPQKQWAGEARAPGLLLRHTALPSHITLGMAFNLSEPHMSH